jgi:hypothetical protein
MAANHSAQAQRFHDRSARRILIIGETSPCKHSGEGVQVLAHQREQDLEAGIGRVFTSNRFIFSRSNEPIFWTAQKLLPLSWC